MKKILILSCVIQFTVSTKAQLLQVKEIPVNDTYGKVTRSELPQKIFTAQHPILFDKYQIEEKQFCQVSNCTKGSDVAFYSNKSGGKQLKKVATNNLGVAIVEIRKDFDPAMAISVKSKNKTGNTGNGMLDFAKEKIFTVKNIKYTKPTEAKVNFTWDASSTIKDGVFEIKKSVDGGITYKVVTTVPLTATTDLKSYTFEDTYTENTVYTIALKNNDTQKSYPIKEFKFTNQLIVKTYPSPVSNTITVQFETKIQNAKYIITDGTGKVFLEGQTTQKTSINVSKLIKGTYLIKLTAAEGTITKQFIKD